METDKEPDNAAGLLCRINLTGALEVDDEASTAVFSAIFRRLLASADVDVASPLTPIDGLTTVSALTPLFDAEDAGIELGPSAIRIGTVEPDRQENLKRNLALSDVKDEDKEEGVGLIVDTDAYQVPIPATHDAPVAPNVYVAA